PCLRSTHAGCAWAPVLGMCTLCATACAHQAAPPPAHPKAAPPPAPMLATPTHAVAASPQAASAEAWWLRYRATPTQAVRPRPTAAPEERPVKSGHFPHPGCAGGFCTNDSAVGYAPTLQGGLDAPWVTPTSRSHDDAGSPGTRGNSLDGQPRTLRLVP
ncbi:MAG: hypothetical protein ACPGUV_09950, partial [Polyangiales bacterium]